MSASEIALTQYVVRVMQQGTFIASHSVNALDALSAINLVEQHYYQPVELEKIYVENEGGKRHGVITANNWHGFMFEAHATGAAPTSVTNLPLSSWPRQGGVK